MCAHHPDRRQRQCHRAHEPWLTQSTKSGPQLILNPLSHFFAFFFRLNRLRSWTAGDPLGFPTVEKSVRAPLFSYLLSCGEKQLENLIFRVSVFGPFLPLCVYSSLKSIHHVPDELLLRPFFTHSFPPKPDPVEPQAGTGESRGGIFSESLPLFPSLAHLLIGYAVHKFFRSNFPLVSTEVQVTSRYRTLICSRAKFDAQLNFALNRLLEEGLPGTCICICSIKPVNLWRSETTSKSQDYCYRVFIWFGYLAILGSAIWHL